ncbi:MAG: hypothetical protein M1821_005505 [Bathelium mastoideum]|nr:MAG: hypothetical protein M1821_005505 [Bathelium mastoideum]KAI9691834.1 MAG: hypothetical protein M1822_007906 [Bathelium mastoideum]
MGSFWHLALLIPTVTAVPLKPRTGQTYLSIGQNYLDEWQSFQSSIETPAGISVYGDIWSGALNSDSQNLLSGYAGSQSGFVEVGMSWKDAMTDNGYTQYQGALVCDNIANGQYDSNLNALGSYLAGYPNVKYIFRVDYEVSGNLHANTNPNEFDSSTFDLTAYPKAFAHVRSVISSHVSNITFMYHPVRGEASLLYPGDDVVDYQGSLANIDVYSKQGLTTILGFSIFNNDVCLPVGSTTNCEGSTLDPNVIIDINFATKPKWVAESSVQPAACDDPSDFITYLTRVTNMIQQYEFAGWTYINSNWPVHGWDSNDWCDSRIETNAPIASWFQTNVVSNNAYVFG